MGAERLAKPKLSTDLQEVPSLCLLPESPGLVRINVRRAHVFMIEASVVQVNWTIL